MNATREFGKTSRGFCNHDVESRAVNLSGICELALPSIAEASSACSDDNSADI